MLIRGVDICIYLSPIDLYDRDVCAISFFIIVVLISAKSSNSLLWVM